jgi:hypothetical protein
VEPDDEFSDAWMIKTDSAGTEEWSEHFGGNLMDCGSCVRRTGDGGYILCGVTETSPGYYDAYLVKTNQLGEAEWSKKYGKGDEWDRAKCVVESPGGGYTLVGRTQSYGAGDWDVWLIKTDEQGNELWTDFRRTFGGTSWDEGQCVQPTRDGGYIIAGMTRSSTYGAIWEDAWLIKTDASGQEEWNKNLGGEAFDFGYSVVQTDDGGYALVGESNSFSGGMNVYLTYYKP